MRSCAAAPSRRHRRRRPCGLAAVRRRREDRRAARAAAARLGAARHHRLPLRQRRQCAARRRPRPRAAGSRLARGRARRGPGLRDAELAVPAHRDGRRRWRASWACCRTRCCAWRARTGARATSPSACCGARWSNWSLPFRCTAATSSTSPARRTGASSTGPWAWRDGARSAADASLFDFLKRVLLGRPLPGAAPGARERYLAFTRRLQQYTAPVAAKGIEDTALYRHHRLVSLNDVGGDPEMFGLSVIGLPRGQPRPRAALAGDDAVHDDARRQALGGRALPHRRDQRDAGGLAPGGAALDAAEPPPQAHRRRPRCAVAQRRVPAVPAAGRQPAVRRLSTMRRWPTTRRASSR